MSKIYLPVNVTSTNCVEIRDKDTIRFWERKITGSGEYNYTDYYINSHYLSKQGSQTYGGMNINYPSCVSLSDITNSYWYRNDIVDSCFIFLTIFIIFVIVVNFLLRTFRRGLFK